MPGPDRASWTAGAPKWAAVLVLTAASTTAIGWALGRSGDSWRTPQRAQAAALSPAPAPPVSPPATPAPTPAPLTVAAPVSPTQPPAPSDHAPLRKLININTASQGELELLPGIGPALAKRILDYRTTRGPFKRIDDLDAVKGIGPKILQRLRPQITIE